MNALSFYRRAAALPFVLPLLCGLVFFALAPGGVPDTPAAPPYLEILVAIGLAGVWGALPYTIYLLVVFGWWRPRTERQLRRRVWLAPLVIGVPFGLLHASAGLIRGDLGNAGALFVFWGTLAVGIGLMYAILIEVSFRVAKSMGWVE